MFGMEDKLELGPEKDIFVTLTKPILRGLQLRHQKFRWQRIAKGLSYRQIRYQS